MGWLPRATLAVPGILADEGPWGGLTSGGGEPLEAGRSC